MPPIRKQTLPLQQRWVSRWLVAWIFLCHLPLPVAHSHDVWDEGSGKESQIAHHIRDFHSSAHDEDAPIGVHWHVVLLWQSVAGDFESGSPLAPASISIGYELPATGQGFEAHSLGLESFKSVSCADVVSCPSGCRSDTTGFLQTYAKPTQLLNVFRC